MKVYNLEKFALEQIYRPFQTMIGYDTDHHIEKLPHTLEATVALLKENQQWNDLVMTRIKMMGVKFPYYIKNYLVEYIEEQTK